MSLGFRRRRTALSWAPLASVLSVVALVAAPIGTPGVGAADHAGPAVSVVALRSSSTTATASASADTRYDSTYYRNAVGRSGASLESSLHTIISANVKKISYSAVWEALKVTDQDPSRTGNVIELYTGTSISKSDNGGNVGQWNREHVWAQSHGDFGTSAGPGTDLHHLRPSDVQVNGSRGNLDFDNGGTQSSRAPGNYSDSDSWEPRDAVKGDVARMVLYMSVRYEGGDGFADLEVNDQVSNGSAPRLGKLSTLLDWNAQDPPSTFERRRNDVIYDTYQNNRNPFIDHPEWADSIWG